jgi:ABC-type transport system involved in multi-copper enzyme maturation permease subunit
MTFVFWKLYHNRLIVAASAFVIYLAVLIPSGIHFAHVYHLALLTCSATKSCDNLGNTLFQGSGLLLDLVVATIGIPALIGMFWGAPLIAKEFEDGTQQFAWTQSVTRKRWVLTLTWWSVLGAVVFTSLMTALITWWRAPENSLFGRFSPPMFDLQGVVPIAYALFAISLGIALSVLFRRVLPAMATTLGVFVAVRVLVYLYVRPHYLAPLHRVLPLGTPTHWSPDDWGLAKEIMDPSGRIASNGLASIPAACHNALFDNSVMQCLATHGYRALFIYQPANRFWTFQWMETGIFVALAAACLAFAIGRITRQDA